VHFVGSYYTGISLCMVKKRKDRVHCRPVIVTRCVIPV